jgi:uracil-DNA glycosylase family protein
MRNVSHFFRRTRRPPLHSIVASGSVKKSDTIVRLQWSAPGERVMTRVSHAPYAVPIQTAEPLVPPRPTINKLREAAADCRACDLWKTGTQTVFGEGKQKSLVMFIGEQPGDKEDLSGRPFVGPAGALLDLALEEAGIDRSKVYVTNVVKHFKWEPRGKRRIHKKPNAAEITACRPWLQSEIRVVRPRAIVCLGATAAQAVIGPKFRVSLQRGQFVASDLAELVTATVHPSSILRAPSDEARRAARARFVEDLTRIRAAIDELRL